MIKFNMFNVLVFIITITIKMYIYRTLPMLRDLKVLIFSHYTIYNNEATTNNNYNTNRNINDLKI